MKPKPPRYAFWTNKEIAFLKQNFTSMPIGELAGQLPRHSVKAILGQARRCRLTTPPVSRNWMAIARAHRPTFIFLPAGETA